MKIEYLVEVSKQQFIHELKLKLCNYRLKFQ